MPDVRISKPTGGFKQTNLAERRLQAGYTHCDQTPRFMFHWMGIWKFSRQESPASTSTQVPASFYLASHAMPVQNSMCARGLKKSLMHWV